MYATEDANARLRALKYTPQHMHCQAIVWAALAPPNTGKLLGFAQRVLTQFFAKFLWPLPDLVPASDFDSLKHMHCRLSQYADGPTRRSPKNSARVVQTLLVCMADPAPVSAGWLVKTRVEVCNCNAA